MNNVLALNYKRIGTPGTIGPKASSSSIHRKTYHMWLGIRKFWKQLLQIPRIIPKVDEKEYIFREQQEVEEAEVERWEKLQSDKRQQKLQ